jgi:hypothetical protein
MSKPRLRLIHSSNGTRLGPVHRPSRRGFRPLVIQGGARAKFAPGASSWESALGLISLGFLTSCHNYVAFLQAGIAVLEACHRTELEKISR